MEGNNEFEDLSRIGLGPLYSRFKVMKYKAAYKYCMTLLSKIDSWEQHYERTKNWFNAPMWRRWELSDLDKKVYFWKMIANNIRKRPLDFYDEFPEEYHCYTEDNYKKLCNWLDKKDERIIVTDNYHDDNCYNDDPESVIMGALSHGYGDEIGYD